MALVGVHILNKLYITFFSYQPASIFSLKMACVIMTYLCLLVSVLQVIFICIRTDSLFMYFLVCSFIITLAFWISNIKLYTQKVYDFNTIGKLEVNWTEVLFQLGAYIVSYYFLYNFCVTAERPQFMLYSLVHWVCNDFWQIGFGRICRLLYY